MTKSGFAARWLIACIVVMLIADVLFAQTVTKTDDYIIHNWTITEGLPVNSVNSIEQGPDGFLWLATYDGIGRFDGRSFFVYNTSTHPELPTNRFDQVMPAGDGTLWVRTERKQLLHYRKGHFYAVNELNGHRVSFISELNRTNNSVFITTDNGAFVYKNESLQSLHRDEIHAFVDDLYPDSNGNIWFTQGETLVQRYSPVNNTLNEILPKDSVKHYLSTYYVPLSQDSLFFTVDGREYIYQPSTQRVTPFPINIEPVSDYDDHYWAFTDLRPDHAGRLTGVTPAGNVYQQDALGSWNLLNADEPESLQFSIEEYQRIFVVNDSTTLIFAGEQIWKNDNVIFTAASLISDVTQDLHGNLWVATRKSGIYRLKPNYFSTIGKAEGLPANNATSLWYDDEHKQLIAGLYGYGFSTIENKEVIGSHYITTTPGTFALNATYYPELYIGVDGEYAYTFNLDKSDGFARLKGTARMNNFRSIYPFGNKLFMGGFNDFIMVDSQLQSAKPVLYPDSLGTINPRFITMSPDSSLWMANFSGGLIHYLPGQDRFITYSDTELQTDQIRYIYVHETGDDNEYELFLGTEDVGMIRIPFQDNQLRIGQATRYNMATGMPDYVVHTIYPDEFGQVWMSTNRGLFRVSFSQLDAFRDGQINRITGVTYREQDGLRHQEFNGGIQTPIAVTPNGQVFLSSQAGVVSFYPSQIMQADSAIRPFTQLTRITTADTTYHQIPKTFALPKEQRTFQLHFTAPNLTSGEKTEYRYRIENYLDDWQYIRQQTQIPISNLNNGIYDIHIQASSMNGDWVGELPVVSLTVEPYFYETIWFKGLLGLAGLAILLGVFRWRTRVLEQRQRELEDEVDRRTEELRNEQQKTKQQAEQLREMDRYKTRFFTNISHELRTPLTLIQSPIKQLLKDRTDKFDPSLLTTFERMDKNSERLKRLIDQTLDLAKSEEGKLKLRAQKIDLSAHLHNLSDLYLPLAEQKNIKYTVTGITLPVHIYCDVDKLDGMVTNLLSNALKFTPENGSVTLQLTDEENQVRISVADTGIGLSKQDQAQVFDQFYQVDSSETRSFEGSGIGLFISKTFAELHHGSLSVSSEQGRGSEFTLTLLKGRDHLSDNQILTDQPDINEDAPFLSHFADDPRSNASSIDSTQIEINEDLKRMMIVEDNEDLRAFLIELFEHQYEVSEFANGVEALMEVGKVLPDLIISDIMMPEMDGYTLNQRLKADPETAGIPVIFLTAKSGRKNQLKGYQEGSDAYISKPFDPTLLKARVTNLIESRNRLRALLRDESAAPEEIQTRSLSPFLTKLTEVMETNYTDSDFNVSELSDKLYLDRSQVLRKIKEECETTPINYIKAFRMQKAIALMKEESGNISEIAYAVGFNSLSYFSRVFKDQFGESPSAYVNKDCTS